jgi:hypothetical protein
MPRELRKRPAEPRHTFFDPEQPVENVALALKQFKAGEIPSFYAEVPIGDPPYTVRFRDLRVQGGYHVHVFGGPDHKQAVIKLNVSGDDLLLDSFFYGAQQKGKDAFKREEDWPGFGPRGMRLVQWVQEVTGCKRVVLLDAWRGRYGETSAEFGALMGDIKRRRRDTLYKTDPEHYDKMHARLVKSGAIDRVAKHGYYGTYGEFGHIEDKMGFTNRRAAIKLEGTATRM